MNDSSNAGIAIAVVMALVMAAASCGPSPSGNRGSARQTTQRDQSHRTQNMVRQVNAVITSLGNAEDRLRETSEILNEDMKQIEDLKHSAATAHRGGQLRDFRTWQRIGREKREHVTEVLSKARNTIAVARGDAETQVRSVSWTSDSARSEHVSRIKQRVTALEQWLPVFDRAQAALAEHAEWLEAQE